MKYKLLILTFATLLPLAAQAQNCFYNGIYFNLDWGDAVVMPLPDGEKYSGKISIPESVSYNGETRSVTAIGEGAFQDCTELTSVSIHSSVKTICDGNAVGNSVLNMIEMLSADRLSFLERESNDR